MKYFLHKIRNYKFLNGKLRVRIQTEKSEKNSKVINLYKSIGFKEIGIKEYPLKRDIVMEIEK